MRSQEAIRARILSFVFKVFTIERNLHEDNILIYSDEKRKQWECMDEITPLYWVLDEPVPEGLLKIAYR